MKALLKWADQVTAGSSGDLKPATKRAIVIVIASAIIRPRVIDISIIRDITNGIAISLITDIDIGISFTSDSNINIGITIAFNSIRRLEKSGVFIELKCFQFTNQLQDLQSVVNSYLYSIGLLFKCKQEAARLSPATWAAIEAELLLPHDD